MNRDEREGKKENLTGRVKEAAGTLTGDEDLRQEGADQRERGQAKEDLARLRRKAGEAIEELGKTIKH